MFNTEEITIEAKTSKLHYKRKPESLGCHAYDTTYHNAWLMLKGSGHPVLIVCSTQFSLWYCFYTEQ